MKSLALVLGLVLVASILVAVVNVAHAATPYILPGDHKIRLVVKFTNDNWNEIYARATPKNNNHVLLNFIYVQNNDKPDCGPSETVYLYLPFKDAKMVHDQVNKRKQDKDLCNFGTG